MSWLPQVRHRRLGPDPAAGLDGPGARFGITAGWPVGPSNCPELRLVRSMPQDWQSLVLGWCVWPQLGQRLHSAPSPTSSTGAISCFFFVEGRDLEVADGGFGLNGLDGCREGGLELLLGHERAGNSIHRKDVAILGKIEQTNVLARSETDSAVAEPCCGEKKRSEVVFRRSSQESQHRCLTHGTCIDANSGHVTLRAQLDDPVGGLLDVHCPQADVIKPALRGVIRLGERKAWLSLRFEWHFDPWRTPADSIGSRPDHSRR